MFWMIIIGFIVLVSMAVIIYTMPSDPTPKVKKKSKELKAQIAAETAAKEASKDWKIIAERWEKQNSNILADVEKLKMHQRDLEKQIESQKAHEKDLLDKLSQEKSWREKEQANLDKIKTHEKDLKAQIIRTEADLEKEHSARIRAEQHINELKVKCDSIQEEKRALNTKAMSLETTLDQANKELKELRAQNIELSRKKEDIQWVAKSDYEALKQQLKQKEQEITQKKSSS
jgi:chromosome segregation ATPase